MDDESPSSKLSPPDGPPPLTQSTQAQTQVEKRMLKRRNAMVFEEILYEIKADSLGIEEEEEVKAYLDAPPAKKRKLMRRDALGGAGDINPAWFLKCRR